MLKLGKCGCDKPKIVRTARTGLLDALMFKWDRWPWLCRSCGTRFYRDDRGAAWSQALSSLRER